MHTFAYSTGIELWLIFPGKYRKIISATHLHGISKHFLHIASSSGYAGCVCVCSRCLIFMSVMVLMLFKSHFMISFYSMCVCIFTIQQKHKTPDGIWKHTKHGKTDEVLNSLLSKTGTGYKVFTLISSFWQKCLPQIRFNNTKFKRENNSNWKSISLKWHTLT